MKARSRQRIQVWGGGAQGPPSGGVELGELGFYVDSADAEEVDVLAVGRGDVGEDLVGYSSVALVCPAAGIDAT